MTRKEAIKFLEQLRMEEDLFKKSKESRALRMAVKTMKRDRMKRAILMLFAAVIIVSAVWLVIGIKSNTQAEDYEPAKGRCYDITFYDGANKVEITTGIEYINKLSEDTVIVTDKSLDEVIEEIGDMQDDAEEAQ